MSSGIETKLVRLIVLFQKIIHPSEGELNLLHAALYHIPALLNPIISYDT